MIQKELPTTGNVKGIWVPFFSVMPGLLNEPYFMFNNNENSQESSIPFWLLRKSPSVISDWLNSCPLYARFILNAYMGIGWWWYCDNAVGPLSDSITPGVWGMGSLVQNKCIYQVGYYDWQIPEDRGVSFRQIFKGCSWGKTKLKLFFWALKGRTMNELQGVGFK